jgi:hypothetical protein
MDAFLGMGGVDSVILISGTEQNVKFLHENETLHGKIDVVPLMTRVEQFWIHVSVVTNAV